MKLSHHSECALLVLVHLAERPQALVSIRDIARALGLSHYRLMKVVPVLRKCDLLHVVRGRSGGVRLARDAGTIGLGEVIRHTERSFMVFEFAVGTPLDGPISAALQSAASAFMTTLDDYTLASFLALEE